MSSAVIVQLINTTASSKSYLSGSLVVPASSTVTAGVGQVFSLPFDPNLENDLVSGAVNLSDTVSTFLGNDAVAWLNNLSNYGPSSAIGVNGGAVPQYILLVGGKDQAGASRALRQNQFTDTSVNFMNSFRNIAGNATTLVKTGAGTLHGLMINNVASGVVTIFDSLTATGTIIATLTLSAGVPTFLGPMGLQFATGLTIVTSGAVTNNITAIYQ